MVSACKMPLVLSMALLAVGLMAAVMPSNTQSAADVSASRYLALNSADNTNSTEGADQEFALMSSTHASLIQLQLNHAHASITAAHKLNIAAHQLSVAAVDAIDSALKTHALQPSGKCTIYVTHGGQESVSMEAVDDCPGNEKVCAAHQIHFNWSWFTLVLAYVGKLRVEATPILASASTKIPAPKTCARKSPLSNRRSSSASP
ncbi:unnamed protein product [Vitrella brassicaformis CCMP3155]|uniref:Uncharacterized protein n=1 Tax=Vitrella brassicaformis (strain CCMP3155) TaxID=1169540 RepID=A0A0G4GHN1_VITBC|nr:unnamed protein product [Vitrella brassicaformis CCMP3155]|eukprot:CEM29139.1 unnamed protein product [Vitrella brassicaformis CCMP3155]